ncbi:hypothetical protein [Mycolicibacterium sarraceniae]|uniref:Uncharacterized protein n=1 Tax=Mycolicibacterium sarraceniae TaxID=1534348 RepID=A0A7I7SJM3_9MYCO|nr:hypothetical protein [Mycolicibacterium sarraceniae]BBY57147.1 hypothetical protein MSAR_02830 [Mycolicibacterium sarraceniae]
MAEDKTRWAIDVMTAWNHDEGAEFLHQRIDAYTAEPDGCSGLITGLVNLSGLLLSGMEATTGKSGAEILQAIASTITRQAEPPETG